jgi:hypothetical protein
MSVVLKIKTPPVPPGVVHSVHKSGTVIYITTPVPDKTTPAVIPAAQVPTVPVNAPVGLSYIRNNRIVGYFADAQLCRDAIDWHISREIEYGADV